MIIVKARIHQTISGNTQLRKEKLDMPDFFKMIKKKKKKTIVFPIYENWSEIGSFQDYDPVKKIKRKN